MEVSVARYLRTPPEAARRQDLISATRTAYAARAIAGARLSLAIVLFGPITVVPHRDKAILFTRSSILFRPHRPPMNGVLVEPPGTAPGSDPLITGAFMSIVGFDPDGTNLGVRRDENKRRSGRCSSVVTAMRTKSRGRSHYSSQNWR